MTDLPELTESDVRRWTDEAFFGRGQGYFRNGYISDQRLQGDTLKARCLGSGPVPRALSFSVKTLVKWAQNVAESRIETQKCWKHGIPPVGGNTPYSSGDVIVRLN